MKKLLRMFKIRREERPAAAVALITLICLHALMISRYFALFSQAGRGRWNIFINNFGVSGFDPITYSVVTYWDTVYNVYRHPLLAFMVWPLSMLNKGLTQLTGMNLVQFIVAVPLLACAFYAFIFMFRIFRDIIKVGRADATLLSALLWPQQGFNPDKLGDIDNLCSKQSGSGYAFNLSEACRISLDRFYEREGQGALTFLHQLFFAPDSPYQKYKTLWNDAVHELPAGPVSDLGTAGDEEWYIGLYALAGGRRVTEFPHSYYSILEAKSDPTTLIYDIDSRYEMEGLKYVSVLMRRLQPSYQLRRNLEQSLNAWADFYRQLTYLQPYILQAQALRPVIYRMMLLRIWQLAGRPQGLTLLPEHAFRQGSGGKTVTTDPLERKCAYFEGVRGDEFFFGSSDCIASIRNELSHGGLITEDYDRLIALWDDFARAWGSSIFYSDSADDAVGENLRANFALTMLTASRIYGFGDYFLLRECISARDGDICALEKERALISLEHELDNKVNAIAAVSRQDAQALSELHSKWLAYQEALADYTEKLEQRGRLSWWQAQLVQATSAVLQTSAVISAPYYREELPDVSLSENYEDDFEDAYLHSELTDLSKQALDEAAQREKERAARAEKEGQPVPQN